MIAALYSGITYGIIAGASALSFVAFITASIMIFSTLDKATDYIMEIYKNGSTRKS